MDELKACPFCGSSNTTLDYYEIFCPQELGTIVVCNDCGASAKSIVDWNQRPLEDALNARIAELEAEVTKGHELQDSYCDRIAELEAFVGKLIEVGHKSVNFVEGFCNTYGNERPKYWHDWKALEDDWKERER